MLSNFVFFKLAEYDPIQLLPEKLTIKLTMFFWAVVLLYYHAKSSEKEFLTFGSILAVLPCFVTSNFMSYPVVPIGFALALVIRYQDSISENFTWLLLLSTAAFIYWIIKDWYDDFALIRILLLFEVMIFVSFARTWKESMKQIIVDGLLLVFLINAIILAVKMFLEPNFRISNYREDLFLIPVSLIGSNSFLVLGLAVYSIRSENRFKNLFYFAVLIFASLLLMISVSRISILSVGLLAFIIIWSQRSSSVRKFLSILAVPVIVFYLIFLLYSEKTLFDLGTIGIRFSIWRLHFFSTIANAPLFGLGFNPEKIIPFLDIRYLSLADFRFVQDYIIHFHTFPLAHNLYFQILSSVGIVGLLFFFYFLFIYLYRFVKGYSEYSAKDRLLFFILIVWLVHEFMDFSSLEVANVFFWGMVLVGVTRINKNENRQTKPIKPIFSKTFLVFSFLLLISFSLRFGFVEQSIFKYHKDVQLSTFYEFQPKNNSLVKKIENKNVSLLKNWKIQFLGARYFFLELALAKDTELEPSLLVQCFQTMPRQELCAANLMTYVLKQKNMDNAMTLSRYLLSAKDPFGIYTRDFL
ncbi:O-antigen ligase family protein [Leptospira noumeaensis]|uniref:O-antigen ligase family protein n=1 Tax=Leptospira noumeaensis TaxID=2484964 RepID=UPI00142E4787|nr:O-antigen ligase family protein [Leptospira noumeaensis]